MKLNKTSKPSEFTAANISIICLKLALCTQLAAAAQELAPQYQLVAKQIKPREVEDLQLVPEVRSLKLSWRYKHEAVSIPASFLVRYCELTSWNEHIKCRHRELEVQSSLRADGVGGSGNTSNETAAAKSNSVIDFHRPTLENKSEGSNSLPVARYQGNNRYEAQIYDLRAQTNYTIQVQVSRFFPNDSPLPIDFPSKHGADNSTKRRQSARRLELPSSDTEWLADSANELPTGNLMQISETKAFKAEATRCLADTTEVLVNTGRHFGGRISVESSSDPRCQLLGNRTSEQSAYLFRIDHELCKSKIMDSNRIETMIIVHENRDILTHNTARFLVICTQMQKSFILKASVSLPKVNNQLQTVASRPAQIKWLASKPTSDRAGKPLRLGSMPGLFRSRSTSTEHPSVDAGTVNLTANELDESPTPSKESAKTNTPVVFAGSNHEQQQKHDSNGRARSMALFSRPLSSGDSLEFSPSSQVEHRIQTTAALAPLPPQPVQVQSSLFFVGGSPTAASPIGQLEARSQVQEHQADNENAVATDRQLQSLQLTSSTSATTQQQKHATEPSQGLNLVAPSGSFDELQSSTTQPSNRLSYMNLNLNQDTEPQSSPILMINNHNHDLVASKRSTFAPNKSRAPSDDFNPTVMSSSSPLDQSDLLAARRMGKSLDDVASISRDAPTTNPNQHHQPAPIDQLLSQDESRTIEQPLVAPSDDRFTLAKNITSRLLKLSLKTMGSVARRTIEMLIKGVEDENEPEPGEELTEQVTAEHLFGFTTVPSKIQAGAPFKVGVKPDVQSVVTAAVETRGQQQVPLPASASPSKIQQMKPSEGFQDGFIISRNRSESVSNVQKMQKSEKAGRVMDSRPKAEENMAINTNSEKSSKLIGSMATNTSERLSAKASNELMEDMRGLNGSWIQYSWPIYVSLLISISIAIFLIVIWLISASPKKLDHRHRQPQRENCIATRCNLTSMETRSNFNDGNNYLVRGENKIYQQREQTGNQDLISIHPSAQNLSCDSSSLDQDGFEDIRGTSKLNLLGGNSKFESSHYNRFENLPCHSSKYTSSGQLSHSLSIRSSLSDGTTLILASDEADCKTNELFYTDHVVSSESRSNNCPSTNSESYA